MGIIIGGGGNSNPASWLKKSHTLCTLRLSGSGDAKTHYEPPVKLSLANFLGNDLGVAR